MNKIKTNIKMRVTKKQSDEVQKIVFDNGGNGIIKNCAFVFIDSNSNACYANDIETFLFQPYEEVDADLFIRTNGTCEEQKGHPHAELMAEYAKDAAETDRPWLLWEYCKDDEVWVDCFMSPRWDPLVKYRRKTQRRTITMPDGTVLPEPVREALKPGSRYYIVDVVKDELIQEYTWKGGDIDRRWLERGLIHIEEENVKAWAKYLLSLTQRS